MTDISYGSFASVDTIWSTKVARHHSKMIGDYQFTPGKSVARRRVIDDVSIVDDYRVGPKGQSRLSKYQSVRNEWVASEALAQSQREAAIVGAPARPRDQILRTALSLAIVVACASMSILQSPVYLAGVIIPLLFIAVDLRSDK